MGEGQQRYSVVVDGPLSRVASGETSIVLSGGDTYMLTVEPGGLLSENMLIFGTVHLMTQEGVEWTVEIELEATTQADEWWMIWTEPGRVIGVMFLVLALSSLAGLSAPEHRLITRTSRRRRDSRFPWPRNHGRRVGAYTGRCVISRRV